jgi:hypothetical protein
MGFVFYDLETTGVSPAYNQPLQFAAIRTDDSFVEIERVNLRCRIAPHIIPSPQALIVTGVTRGASREDSRRLSGSMPSSMSGRSSLARSRATTVFHSGQRPMVIRRCRPAWR